jgi:hypothetical protein
MLVFKDVHKMMLCLMALSFLAVPRAFAGDETFHSWDEACARTEAAVAEGDLIFLDIPNPIFRQVAAATKTWTSHVGVVFKDEQGQWIVDESKVPFSKQTPLCDFLKTSSEYLFEVKRLNQPLAVEDIAKMHAKADAMRGRLYDLGFDFDSDRMFCSKFAYLVYQEAGVEAGRVQTFRELLTENPDYSLTFWQIWFLGDIPWERLTVTPASQLNDEKFISILKGAPR